MLPSMKAPATNALAWATGFAAVSSFYVHPLFQTERDQAAPISAIAIGVGISGLAFLGFAKFAFEGVRIRPLDNARLLALMCGAYALTLCIASTLAGAADMPMNSADWGIFGLNVGIPLLLLCCSSRLQLLNAIGVWSVLFACADAFANVLTFLGIAPMAHHVGHEQKSYGVHFLGVCGNILAEGTVSFIAITFLVTRQRTSGNSSPSWAFARPALITVLLVSLWLTGSRTYITITVVALILLLVRWSRPLPLALISAAVAIGFLWRTFTAPYDDQDDILRGWLLQSGWEKAKDRLVLGAGSFYRDVSSTQADYISAMTSGVTESSWLDYAISYGMPAAVLLSLCAMLSLSSRRSVLTWPTAIAAMITGTFAIAGPVGSFLGSTVYYGSLLYVIFDEPFTSTRNRAKLYGRTSVGILASFD